MTNQGASDFSSSSTHSYVYDVFLSYNSADTGAFSRHLHYTLCGMGINTYLHEGPVSEKMLPTFSVQSKMIIIVFSEALASSTWLDQVAKILQCRKSKQQLLHPIFYKMDPTTLLDRSVWKAAPWKVEDLSRWWFREGYDSHFVHMVVKDIASILPNGRSVDVPAMHTIGMSSRVGELCHLLKIGEPKVHMLGICGMGGIGKTTLARSVFNSIGRKFEGTCFLANVRETSMLHEGLVRLQENLLNDILDEDRSLRLTNVYQGMQLIEERLRCKRVLVVLDDVYDYSILEGLARPTWFGSGSRIIITTRIEQVLRAHQATIYRPGLLDVNEALELFSWHAFRGHPFPDYAEVAMYAVKYAYGVPLHLIVLGCHLHGRSIDEWKETSQSKADSNYEIVYHALIQSYDALDDNLKIAFLDIACFFKGKEVNHVQQILEDSGLNSSAIAIQELVDKALITIERRPSVGGVILMHDMIQEMGRDIVQQQSHEPGGRSRLWHHEDVDHVLTSNTGTDKIRGIMVEFPNPDEICILLRSETDFSNMKNLKFIISGPLCFPGDLFHSGESGRRKQNQAFANCLGRWNERSQRKRRAQLRIQKYNSFMAAGKNRRTSNHV